VRSWDPGSIILLEANADYVLGKPRIDEIEIRFILDGNTLTAAVLAGTIDIVADLESVDRGIAVRDGWRDGQVVFGVDGGGALWMHPQFVNPRPSAILDLQFRRGLLHAIDRQDIAGTLGGGVTPVAHSFLDPGQAAYREIEAAIPWYEYDPRRAAQLLEGLGYSRRADGFLHNQAGQRLEVEIVTVAAAAAANAGTAVADYWQRVGVGASSERLTPRLAEDPEALAAFPGFYIATQPKDLDGLWSLHSSRARLPENRFQAPAPPNISRYMNAEVDGLVASYFRTLAVPERIAVLGRIVHHVADQLPVMGIMYAARPDGFANRLINVSTRSRGNFGTNPAWNAHEWDVRT
jgi:peptide/nickel transport system substrate-binding protein